MKTDAKNRSFNIFDIVIVVSLIVCIAAIALKYTYFEKKTVMNDQAVIEFTVENIMQETAEAGSSGDVFLRKGDLKVGAVMNTKIVPHTVHAINADGVSVVVEDPLGKKNLTGRMTLNGTFETNGFFVGDQSRITVGANLPVYILDPATGNGCAVEITVNSIRDLSAR